MPLSRGRTADFHPDVVLRMAGPLRTDPSLPSLVRGAPKERHTHGSGRAEAPLPDPGAYELEFLTQLDAAPDRLRLPEDHAGAPYGGTGWREDLTRRLRVLLHTAPLLALRAADGLQAPDRKHYDSLALALRVFDLVLASMGLDRGVDRTAMQRALQPLLAAMDDAAGYAHEAARHEAVVDRVLGALLNDDQRREMFRATYTDLRPDGTAEAVSLPYRLLEEYQQPDGGLALRLTSEAINLFLGALDRDIEDEQVAMEALVREQLERGSFAKAVQSADSAQFQSRRYTLYIETKLRLTRRDLKLVNWRAEMTPLLDQAHIHVQRRIQAERAILEVACEQANLLIPGSPEAAQVAIVIRLITQCCARHSLLTQTLAGARVVFLDEQGRQGFAAAMEGQRPDFVRDILEPVLQQPSGRAIQVTDAALTAIAAPRAPTLLDLSALINWCLKPRRDVPPGAILVHEPDMVDLPSDVLRFPVEVRRVAEAALRGITKAVLLSDLLSDGLARGWASDVLDCVTLLVSLEHGRDAKHVPLVDLIRTTRRFTVAGIAGDDLLLLPAGMLVPAPSSAESAR